MKFGQEYRQALETGDYPAHWLEAAVPYRQLKKILKKIQAELESLGLDPATIAKLTQPNKHPDRDPKQDQTARRGSSSVALKYDFEGDESFHPRLTLFINREDGTALDARLTPATRTYLESLVGRQQGATYSYYNNAPKQIKASSNTEDWVDDESKVQRIDVPMSFDAVFFQTLQVDVSSLDALQTHEQELLTSKIEELSSIVKTVARPSTFFRRKFEKNDLYRWRELFDLYLQAGIFFSTHENDHGSRSSVVAAEKLQWFQKQVMDRGITKLFKLPESAAALDRFININIGLLQNMKFLEYNEVAIRKILKKFDKRTNLGAAQRFPKLILPDQTMSGNMAKNVCTQLSQDLVQLVPQVEDNSCPICMELCYRPVRMNCTHTLCILCVIKLQKEKKDRCPLCRVPCVRGTTIDNIDSDREKYLERYFPKEVRAKQIVNETYNGVQTFGPSYTHPSEDGCVVQ